MKQSKSPAALATALAKTLKSQSKQITDAIDALDDERKAAVKQASTAQAKIEKDFKATTSKLDKQIRELNELHARFAGKPYLTFTDDKQNPKPGKRGPGRPKGSGKVLKATTKQATKPKPKTGSAAAGNKALAYLKDKGDWILSSEIAAHIGTKAVAPSLKMSDEPLAYESKGPGKKKLYRYVDVK